MNERAADPTPAAPAQSPLWLLQQLDPHSAAYNLAFHLELEGPLDPEAMDRAWRGVLTRHPVLRCRFVPGESGAQLEPLPIEAAPLERVGCPPDEAATEIAARAAAPFDLGAGPASRARLYEVGPDRHRLAFVFHHAVFDGWSLNLLLSEMAAGYTHALGEGPAPDPLDRDYLQYARGADLAYRTEAWSKELEYWQGHLTGASAELDLPRRRRAPSFPRLGHTLRDTHPDLAEPIRALAARAEATPFMVLLAAYAALLGRYTDATELVIGTPLATRLRPSVRPLIGLFLNTVALRVSVAGAPSFLELVARVREAALGAFRNYTVPFDRVVEALHPARRTGQNPIFSTMFITQNPPVPYRFAGLSHRYFDDDPGAAKFDLTLSTQLLEGDLTLALESADDRLDEAAARGLLDGYRVLLSHALEDPERSIAELSWLRRDAGRAELRRWAGADLPTPPVGVVKEIEAQVASGESRVAVQGPDGARTYAELWAASGALARALAARGIGPGDRVGVRVGRDARLPETLLGVLRAGAAFIPLDGDAPVRRRRAALEDAQARALIVDAPEAEEAPEATEVLEREGLADADAALPDVALGAPAYVIYTSGSSGRPKGVQIAHRALASFDAAARAAVGLGREDVVLATTTVAFDISILELLTPLTVGAAVHVVDRDVAVDGARLARAIAASGATVFQATPSALRLLVTTGWRPPKRLRVLAGGEALPRDLALELVDRVGALFDVYGPTEATVWVAARPLTRAALEDAPDVVPIGGPFDGTALYILSQRGHPVPPGARGELCISGPQVADGYLGHPALNAARFDSDPFAPDAMMYRTGDVVRARHDGSIEFLGRSDHQVKIRGFRVEPSEIEAALRRQSGLHDAVVIPVEAPGGLTLVAYVVADREVTAEGLRSSLREELPAYMIPARVQVVSEIPRNHNGKLDRARLPEVSHPPAVTSLTEPHDEIEARLLELWRALLGRRDVGVEDNFFDVGGHSMLAARLAQKVERGFGARLEVSTFFHAQTVSQQAEAIRQGGFEPTWAALDPLKASGSQRPLFYIGASDQARLLSEQLDPDQPMYALKVLGLPDTHAMQVEEVARSYVDEIRAFQPDGPYAIAGYCQDAKLALAVAERLQALGETVARMIYLDVVWAPPEKIDSRRQFAENMTDIGPEYALRWLRQQAKDRLRDTSEFVYDRVSTSLARRRGRPAPLTTRQRVRIHALRRSMANFPERAFDGDLDILLSQEFHRAGAQHALRHMATGRLRVLEIPGLHHDMFAAPAVYWLASRISRCLREAFSEADAEDRAAPRPPAAEDPA